MKEFFAKVKAVLGLKESAEKGISTPQGDRVR